MLTHAKTTGKVKDPAQVQCKTFLIDDGTPKDLQYRICALYQSICYRVRDRNSITLDEAWSDYRSFYETVKLLPGFNEWAKSEGGTYHMDKDTLVTGNRIYGPDVCQFIKAEANKEQGVQTIRKKVIDTKTGKVYESQTSASAATGVGQRSISYSCTKAKNGRFKFH